VWNYSSARRRASERIFQLWTNQLISSNILRNGIADSYLLSSPCQNSAISIKYIGSIPTISSSNSLIVSSIPTQRGNRHKQIPLVSVCIHIHRPLNIVFCLLSISLQLSSQQLSSPVAISNHHEKTLWVHVFQSNSIPSHIPKLFELLVYRSMYENLED
jgi:hypothetical protein